MKRYKDVLTVDEIKAVVQQYFSKTSVNKVCLFGSYAKGIPNDASDIDLVVFLDKGSAKRPSFFQWHVDLCELLGHNVDLLSDINDYKGSSYRFRRHIERYMIPIYEKQISQ